MADRTERIAVLGTGLLGAGFVRAFRRRGVEVRVWNRTRAKADALAETGAVVCDSPEDAVRGVDRVHLVLSDDAAVDGCLDDAGDALPALVIDHTTALPAGVVRRTEALADRSLTYVHAPVFMAPANARDGTGLMLISGPKHIADAVTPALEPMTGKVAYVGERVDQAAAFKLFGNSVLVALTAAASDVLAMARALGIDGPTAMSLFSLFDPGPALKNRGGRMATGAYTPASFELTMARKDVRLMIETAGDERLILLPNIAARMDELIDQGYGADDMCGLGRP